MSNTHYISNEPLDIYLIANIMRESRLLDFSDNSIGNINKCRTFLEEKLEDSNIPFYGINTGFGSLCDVHISKDEIHKLQRNLVVSHACGTGEEVPGEVVKLILLLKIQSLSLGFSGVRLQLVKSLVHMYNHDVLPVIYQQGSLGASGDLAPLAHMSLPLLGLGQVRYKGEIMSPDGLPESVKWKIEPLESKEGLALLNGTQFSLAYGVWSLINGARLNWQADLVGAMSLDAFRCQSSPFDDRLQQVRPHKGQVNTANEIRYFLEGSEIAGLPPISVQDPYAFRCIPQVHGASKAAFDHVLEAFTTEMNAVTDNPTIFPDSDAILSGGNFHAQPLALPLDYLAIALAELGNISERRTFQLISGQRDLPPFLIADPGLKSGMMIPQYTAASIVSQNKQLCSPASVDSIVSSNGQEDHVSMAANAATKLYRVVQNVENIMAIEFMAAAQAIGFRRPSLSSPRLEAIISKYRQYVPKLEEDRVLSNDIKQTVSFLRNLERPD
ncbi:MAG: histidine ammonia-lyase [Bacteroidota bacterium]